MTVKTRLFWFLPLAFVFLSGCGTTSQQSRFQSAFLPSVPRAVVVPQPLDEPPKLNPYLAEVPALVASAPELPAFTKAEGLMKRAEQRFQRGRKFYQAQDAENARKQFDEA